MESFLEYFASIHFQSEISFLRLGLSAEGHRKTFGASVRGTVRPNFRGEMKQSGCFGLSQWPFSS